MKLPHTEEKGGGHESRIHKYHHETPGLPATSMGNS